MECKYCKSENVIRKGKNEKGIQRYYCKDCYSYFLEEYEKNRYQKELKEIALRLYTDGVEIAVIARSLEVPYETVRSCYSFGMRKSKICGLGQKERKL